MLWVTILGTEEEAQTFEAKIIACPHYGMCDTSIKIRGKVYNIDMSKEEVLQDQRGILEMSKNMADKIGIMRDGKLRICTEYDIIRK